jgi:hypothetical protein
MRLHDLVSGLIILSGAALLSTTVAAQSTESLTHRGYGENCDTNHPQIQAAREMAVAADGPSGSLRLLSDGERQSVGRLRRSRQPRRGRRVEQLDHL